MEKSVIALFAAVALGSGILGFFLGTNSSTPELTSHPDGTTQGTNSTVRFGNHDTTSSSDPNRPGERSSLRKLWTGSGSSSADLQAIISKSLSPTTGRRDWVDRAIALDGIPTDRIPEALALLEDSKQGGWSRRGAIATLLANWADDDTPTALAYAESLTSTLDRKHAINAVLGSWAEDDPQAADKWLKDNIDPGKQSEYLSNIITAMARNDPSQALDYYLSTIKTHPRQEWSLSTVFRQWAAQDPEAASTRALGLPSAFRKQAMKSLAGTWISQDEERAIEWVRSLPAGPDKNAVLQSTITHLAQSDTDKAITLMDELTNPDDRRNIANQLANTLANKNITQALEWAESLEVSLQGNVLRSVVTEWAKSDPKKAMAYAENIESPSDRESSISAAASSWMQRDPDECFKWIGTLDDSKSIKMISNMSYSIPTDRIDGTLSLLASLPNNDNKDNAVRNLLSRWSDRDPEAALQWIVGKADSTAQKAGIESVLRNIAGDDPGRAIQVALNLSDEETRNKGTRAALSTWARYQPAEAAQWAAGLTGDEKLQQETLPSIIGQWARDDSYAASAFLETLPSGKVRDSSVERFANQVRREDPEAAVLWADTIENKSTRTNALRNAARTWLKQEPAAARAWIQQSDLPTNEKDRLLKNNS